MVTPLENLSTVVVAPASFDIRGVVYRFRLVDSDDAEMLDAFLRSLSAETKLRWGAHNAETLSAAEACANLRNDGSIRIIAEIGDEVRPAMAAYVVLQEQIPDYEHERFAEFGLRLDGQTLRVAPVVSDVFQGRGVGSEMMRWTISLAHKIGVSQLILWGGVHDDNLNARRLYENVGFSYTGSFYWRKPELSTDPIKYHYMALDVASVVSSSPELLELCQVAPE